MTITRQRKFTFSLTRVRYKMSISLGLIVLSPFHANIFSRRTTKNKINYF